MRLSPNGAFRRCLGILAVAAFAATGPGLSGLEVMAHLSGVVDLTHARQPHFEQAGRTGHADQCQLGRAEFRGGGLFGATPSLRQTAISDADPATPVRVVLPPTTPSTALPRAPPA